MSANIVFPKSSRLSQKNIKNKEERTRISSRCRCCIFTPLSSLLLLRGSYFLFPYFGRRSAAEPFPSFFQSRSPSFFYLMAFAAQLPTFETEEESF